MPLSDTAVRQAKPTDKPRKLPDEKGLYLLLTLSGGKLWRYEQKTLVIHNTDEVSFQQVWAVLGQAMHLPIQICRQIAVQAHRDGTADVFTASREVVEAKRHVCERIASAVGCEQLPFSVRDGTSVAPAQ